MKTLTIAAAAAASLMATSALAQDGGLTREDIEAFIAPIGDEAEQAVASGDWEGIASWISEHVEDETPIAMAGYVMLSQGPTATFAVSMKGEDLQNFARMASMGGPQGMGMGDAVEDYSLETEIKGFWQVPGDKASAEVAFYESGMIVPPEGAPEGARGGPFSSATVCALRMGRDDDDLTIEMASCEVKSML